MWGYFQLLFDTRHIFSTFDKGKVNSVEKIRDKDESGKFSLLQANIKNVRGDNFVYQDTARFY